jgi:hypothetical protein
LYAVLAIIIDLIQNEGMIHALAIAIAVPSFLVEMNLVYYLRFKRIQV